MHAAKQPAIKPKYYLVGGAAIGLICLALAAVVLISSANAPSPVRLSHWQESSHVGGGNKTAAVAQVDFKTQVAVAGADGSDAFVLPLTDVPGPSDRAGQAPRILGALVFNGQTTLTEAQLEMLLGDIRAMGPRGPIVGMDLKFVGNGLYSDALRDAVAQRPLTEAMPVFELRAPTAGATMAGGIFGLGALALALGAGAASVMSREASVAEEVAARGTHFSIKPYRPQMVTGEDGMQMLRKVVQPLSASDRPMEVYSVAAPHLAADEEDLSQAEEDAALIEAFAADKPAVGAGDNPAEEVQAAVRAAEERRRAVAEAAVAEAKAKAALKRAKPTSEQSEDEALSILTNVAAEVGDVSEEETEEGLRLKVVGGKDIA